MAKLHTKEELRSFYLYLRSRRLDYQRKARKILGNACSRCGCPHSPDSALKLRFVAFDDPLKLKYKTNPVTLHRRLCREPDLRDRIELICPICSIKGDSQLG